MKVGIIGGGASGCMAAIMAADAGAEVTVLEKNDKLGKKILMTGNGKCNFSNLSFSNACYYSAHKERAQAVFEQFTPADTVTFFEQLGMRVRNRGGYLYPASEQASTVAKVLQYALEERSVRIIYQAIVKRVAKEKGVFTVRCQDGSCYRFDRLIIACGGQASPKTGSDGSGCYLAGQFGHTVVPLVPALVQLRCEGGFFPDIAGIRCDARLQLIVDGNVAGQERGELQVTEYGISGIVVFQLSRMAAYALAQGQQTRMSIDLLPDVDQTALAEFARQRYERYRHRTVEGFFTGILQEKWISYFAKLHGFLPTDRMEKHTLKQVQKLLFHMKCFQVTVTGTNSFQNAQVTAGGIRLEEVTDQLESRLTDGLYLAGELLDVDGKCGGYNLQWAWSSGYTAGRASTGNVTENKKVLK